MDNHAGFVLSSSSEGESEADNNNRIVGEDVVFRCNECDVTFDSVDAQVHHDRVEHKKVTSLHKKCKLCQRYFFCRSDLKKHYPACRLAYERSHCYECTYCEARFSSTHERRVHQSWCDKKGSKFVCEVETCTFRTEWKGSLTRHYNRWHSDRQKFKCPHCSKETLNADSMTRHQKACSLNPVNLEAHFIHEKKQQKTKQKNNNADLKVIVDNHICELCHGEFVMQGALENHKRICDPQFVCKYCNVAFNSENNVNTHQRFCSKRIEEQFTCKFYTMAFD